jgi:2-polyprenyl-3-methyl-5-hydroxy-6-metoxy-1,4-benzoquinol methylase
MTEQRLAWRVRLIGLADRQRPAFSPHSKTRGYGMPQINHSTGQSLSSNERAEAEAFDRVAGKVDRNTLRTSEGTFLRYRRATVGNPLYPKHPDLMFSLMGRLFNSERKPQDKPLQGIRVLDLGAGDGSWSVILADQGAEVVSAEISPKQVALARERMSLVNLSWDARVGSAFQLRNDFPQNSFDLVFGQGVLHHLTQDLPRVWADSSQLLREGDC